MVEAAAVDLPGLAPHAFRQHRTRFQAKIEMDEVERAPDPRNAGDHMQPSDDDAYGLSEDGLHALQPRLPGTATMAEGLGAVQACAGSVSFGGAYQ